MNPLYDERQAEIAVTKMLRRLMSNKDFKAPVPDNEWIEDGTMWWRNDRSYLMIIEDSENDTGEPYILIDVKPGESDVVLSRHPTLEEAKIHYVFQKVALYG
jgi:hypothetical protein